MGMNVHTVSQPADNQGAGAFLSKFTDEDIAHLASVFRDESRADNGQDAGGIQIHISQGEQNDRSIDTLFQAGGIVVVRKANAADSVLLHPGHLLLGAGHEGRGHLTHGRMPAGFCRAAAFLHE